MHKFICLFSIYAICASASAAPSAESDRYKPMVKQFILTWAAPRDAQEIYNEGARSRHNWTKADPVLTEPLQAFLQVGFTQDGGEAGFDMAEALMDLIEENFANEDFLLKTIPVAAAVSLIAPAVRSFDNFTRMTLNLLLDSYFPSVRFASAKTLSILTEPTSRGNYDHYDAFNLRLHRNKLLNETDPAVKAELEKIVKAYDPVDLGEPPNPIGNLFRRIGKACERILSGKGNKK